MGWVRLSESLKLGKYGIDRMTVVERGDEDGREMWGAMGGAF
jgi:hypothetical protein